jgi:aminoglycoside phosphotransferase family enzyme/predicted kinase
VTCIPEPLDPHVVALLAQSGAEHVQTHLSHVFLTRERVYKLHKAVRFDFVDFGTRASRNEDSLREVRLNRRLAPDVYLGVAPVHVDGPAPGLGTVAETLVPDREHCIVMRRLPHGRDALSLLERGELHPVHVDAIAARIAELHDHAGLGAPAPLEAGLLSTRARAAGARAFELLEHQAQRLETRRRDGRVVDGHGDLHLQHVWFEHAGAPPLAIDCLAFRDDYRQIDGANDVAFLAMDLEYRGRRDLGERFVRSYAALRDDFDLYGVLDLFIAYRAAVRAKVADLATRDAGLAAGQRDAAAASAERHLALAEAALAPVRHGAIMVIAGAVGSGKSSVAAALADSCGGVVLSSDRLRKRLAGLAPTARGHAEIYTGERTEEVYAALLARAAPVVLSGRLAILDATFARASFRSEVLAWAAAHAVRAVLIETTCGRAESLARLAARTRAGDDPSDAGPERLAASLADFEPTDDWPADARRSVATDRDGWRDALPGIARDLGVAELCARASHAAPVATFERQR